MAQPPVNKTHLPTHLVSEHGLLKKLSECATWRELAATSVANWPATEAALLALQQNAQNTVSEANQLASQRPWWKRVLQTPEQKSAKFHLKQASIELAQEKSALNQLQTLIEVTPSTESERKHLIAELRFQKKELQAVKKESELAMREVRTKARRDSISAGTTQAVLGIKGYAAAQRRSIASTREDKLEPHANQKRNIEIKILAIDRQIAHYESL